MLSEYEIHSNLDPKVLGMPLKKMGFCSQRSSPTMLTSIDLHDVNSLNQTMSLELMVLATMGANLIQSTNSRFGLFIALDLSEETCQVDSRLQAPPYRKGHYSNHRG